ncbi:phosphatase PAP2 family protein [Actinophytocola sp. NPDC049390]|uniref:phosphatase PAP2 family protein n=1 Tax=Actinophytocola sp. NPDC049390 TaxID=3363894 RepID=UPI0037AB9DFA
MPVRVARPLGVVALCAAVTLVVLGFVFAGTSATAEFGIPVEHRPLQSWELLAPAVDWTGEPDGAVVVLATLVVVFLRAGNRRAAVLAVAGPAATVTVTTVMKPLVGRTINDGYLSFPSGHTASATAFALVAMLVLVGGNPARAWLLAVVPTAAGAAMAWAQVLLNAHYPTDTIGGFCAALAVVPAVAWVIDRAADRRSRSTGGRSAAPGEGPRIG